MKKLFFFVLAEMLKHQMKTAAPAGKEKKWVNNSGKCIPS